MSIGFELRLLTKLCNGFGVNVGCGDTPIAGSIGIDVCREAKAASIFIDSLRLPFPDNSLDYIVSSACLEHMQEAPITVLREWARCLMVGGVLGIVVPDAEYGIWSMTGDTGKCGELIKERREMEHLHAFTEISLCVLLEFAGFTITEVKHVDRRPLRKETTLFVSAYKNETFK